MNRASDSFVEDPVVSDKPHFLAAGLGHEVSRGAPRGWHSDTGDPLAVYQVVDNFVGHVSEVKWNLASHFHVDRLDIDVITHVDLHWWTSHAGIKFELLAKDITKILLDRLHGRIQH